MPPIYLDAELGDWLHQRRMEIDASALSVSQAVQQYLGVPLSPEMLYQIERAKRYPAPWHVRSLAVTLGLLPEQREELVQLWSKHPLYAGVTWRALSTSTWDSLGPQREPCAHVWRMPRVSKPPLLCVRLQLQLTSLELAAVMLGLRKRDISDVSQITMRQVERLVQGENVPLIKGDNAESRPRNLTYEIKLLPNEIQALRRHSGGLVASGWARRALLAEVGPP